MTDREKWEAIKRLAPVMAILMKDAKRLGITFTLKKAEFKQ